MPGLRAAYLCVAAVVATAGPDEHSRSPSTAMDFTGLQWQDSAESPHRQNPRETTEGEMADCFPTILEIELGSGRPRARCRIEPAANQLTQLWVTEALAAGTIASPTDATICTGTLIAAAFETAHARGSEVITAEDVQVGWRDRLRVLDICDDPWVCFQRSIVSRLPMLETRLPHLRQVIDAIAKP